MYKPIGLKCLLFTRVCGIYTKKACSGTFKMFLTKKARIAGFSNEIPRVSKQCNSITISSRG